MLPESLSVLAIELYGRLVAQPETVVASTSKPYELA